MQEPKISVVLPIKNGERYLSYLTEVVSRSCADHDEILVISDGSSDGTLPRLRDWARLDNRVNLIETRGIGLVNVLNLGLDIASHPWIARFDVDDRYSIGRLNVQKLLLREAVSAIFTDYQFRTAHGVPLGKIFSAIHPMETAISLVSGARTAHPSVIFNRDKAKYVGGYREIDFPAEDLSLWMRMSTMGDLITVPEFTLQYTLSRASITSTQRTASLQKRNELVKSYVNKNYQKLEVVDLARNSTQNYQSDSNAEIRSLLHLRDLQIMNNLLERAGHENKEIKQEIIKSLTNLQHLPAVSASIFSKIARDLYRKI
jgi:glycosyltransferase involved in cell wall biosynthesis